MMDSAPAQVGPYIPQQLLATGAQATVWLGTGPRGTIALKIARGDSGRRALRREAEILRGTSHPNLVRLIEADPEGEWIAIERIEGNPVDQWAQNRSIDEILDVALQLVDVLEHLHGEGIVHADVKPSNVMVTGGMLTRSATIVPGAQSGLGKAAVKLIDLGIAMLAGDTVDGFRGTLGYAAPELLNGRPPSPSTDLYGLGGVLYTALTGRTPFVAADPAALTYLPLVSLPAPPAAFRPEIPAPLNQLVLSLLSRDPDRRPTELARLREAIDKCRGALPGPPVLGMLDEREELRRAVVGAADGEPRVAVLYARREGLPYLKGTDPQGALEALREAGRPAVVVMKAGHRGARQLADMVLKEGLKCLLLLHSDRPVPGLTAQGAIQLTPAPLSSHDAVRLARIWSADTDQAEIWWRLSMGLPIAVLARIRAWRRERGMPQGQIAHLPAESRRIYDALRNKPKMRCLVVDLAAELQMQEHTLLDHAEVLFAEELVEPSEEGLSITVVRSRSIP
jgi:hypothetical protein